MKIYFAGMYHNGLLNRESNMWALMNEDERAICLNTKHRLESFYYVKDQTNVDRMRADGIRIFLDSGAFSVYTMGKTIDLKEYCRYIKENHDIVEVASVLDSVGDQFKTYQNQVLMERQGTNPLPCFHWGEDERYLEHYVANYEYITLGGLVVAKQYEFRKWLDHIFPKYICRPDGTPKVKVHGFAITSIPLMTRYPWYSVDSSAWVTKAFNGQIILPDVGIITISDTSPARKDEGLHLSTFTPPQRQAIRELIQQRGFDPERLANVYVARWAFNIQSFEIIQRTLEAKKPHFIAEQISIF